MSQLPNRMADRWKERYNPGPDEGTVYWHVLFQNQPQVAELARVAHEKLAPFHGLHMTPAKWLHMTTFRVGSTYEITSENIEQLIDEGSRRLAGVSPAKVVIGKVLYHPEAIMLHVQPKSALLPIHLAVKQATHKVLPWTNEQQDSVWTPHITLCYSEADQLAQPLISALGRELPSRTVTITSVDLIIQRGAERLWDWSSVASVPLVGSSAS
ncbi:hypothetical protein GCM10009678_90260 [Actinomadura kijaniata]|uniref:2'-5' RNA ligase n=1 Tax=Actinomadura namibiensis TaxID=182080 RepID=A0A7W3QLU6_ACTNM|nr:2'-5' RNA ligase family protein [Actinomadura namibiensis]MBA8951899.1 2'-5' RNA ligase [Actinomadura namibiensis]